MAFTMKRDEAAGWSLLAGIDARFVTGETNEDVGTFRQREAGGEQRLAGLFAIAEHQADDLSRLSASARMDGWWLDDGRRLETSLASGAQLRSDGYDDRDGLEPSASVEFTRTLCDDLEARVSAGTSFRLPSLNELYRPFRVRNDIVEANPQLDPERFISVEAGLEWKPHEDLTIGAGVFHHWISDAIANVPITDPAEITAIFGTIPPGGSGSIRRNVDQARVAGIEADAEWRPSEQLRFGITGLWSDTRFVDSSEQPLLEGKPFPQAPDLRLIASGEWQALENLTLFAGGEYGAAQYDDALAQRRITDFTSVRLGMAWRFANAVYQIRVENLFDEEIQTGLSSDGLRTIAGPRSLWLGAEWAF
jgi:outer membrane receptor protein involved in Fe transport